MELSDIVGVGAAAAGGYLLWRYLNPVSAEVPPLAAPPGAARRTAAGPAASPVVLADARDSDIPVSPGQETLLLQRLIQVGGAGRLKADEWNAIIVQNGHAAYDLDHWFGAIGRPNRQSLWDAQSFLNIATGKLGSLAGLSDRYGVRCNR